jgi:hypothetical protein
MGLGSLIGGGLQAFSALQGASDISNAADQANKFGQGVYNTEQSSLAPYLNTGQGALYSLASLLGIPGATAPTGGSTGGVAGATPQSAFQSYTQTPAYQFPLQQGLLSLQQNNAARGLLNSGATAKDLSQYGTGYASQGLNTYLSQLAGVAGGGASAATSLGQTGSNLFGTLSNNLLTSGGAQAAGLAGAVGAFTGQQGALSPFLNGLNGSSFGGGGASAAGSPGSLQQILGLSGAQFVP